MNKETKFNIIMITIFLTISFSFLQISKIQDKKDKNHKIHIQNIISQLSDSVIKYGYCINKDQYSYFYDPNSIQIKIYIGIPSFIKNYQYTKNSNNPLLFYSCHQVQSYDLTLKQENLNFDLISQHIIFNLQPTYTTIQYKPEAYSKTQFEHYLKKLNL